MVAIEDNIADSLNFKVSLFDSKLDEEEEDLEKDDFELIDGDVTTQMVDNVSDIQFSDKYVRCSIRASPRFSRATYKNNIIQATGGMIGQSNLGARFDLIIYLNDQGDGLKLGSGGVSMAINSGIKGALIVAQAKGHVPKPMGNKGKESGSLTLILPEEGTGEGGIDRNERGTTQDGLRFAGRSMVLIQDMVQSLMHVLGTGVRNNSIKAME
ncbi:hypothetical protein Golax_019515, partial [Gossypium laxum]|nr:hypothetical protein [Gossypium laxum]